MTTKEAIKILSREKECVQQALQRCADGSGYVSPDGMIRAADYVEACSVALQALLAQQEREDPKPLTLDELRQMDAPVWCVCKPLEGGDGYWCLCKNGTIITPAGSSYDVAEIPHWHFLRHKPKEEPHE